MVESHPAAPVRGTQLLVEHLSGVVKHPVFLAIELGWRWLVGIPILFVCWRQAQQILAAYPLESSGWNSLDAQNPWVAAVQLAGVWNYYLPHVVLVLRWLLPASALAWVVVSALGRNLLIKKLAAQAVPHLRFRPAAMIGLQAAWMILLAVIFWGWYRSIQWVAATHISISGEPDLVGYAVWTVFLTLGFFTAWALVSWSLSIAPLLLLLEHRSAFSALGQSLRLGKPFTSKLAEINLVMGIVKIMLLVLAMVFSSVTLPFSGELGGSILHTALAASSVFYLIAIDFFQVVRLKAFIAFWQIFRAQHPAHSSGQGTSLEAR